MTRSIRAALFGITLCSSVGCGHQLHGIITSDERRIWVVRTDSNNGDVYRCGDGAGPDAPPQPVCVRAPMVETPR